MLQGTLWNPADILTAIQDRRSKVDGDFAPCPISWSWGLKDKGSSPMLRSKMGAVSSRRSPAAGDFCFAARG